MRKSNLQKRWAQKRRIPKNVGGKSGVSKKLINKSSKLRKLALGLATATAVSGAMPAMSAFAAPPVYRSNELEEVMITRIIPSEAYFEFSYNRLGTRAEEEKPVYINLQYGEISDATLHVLESGKIAGNTVVARGHVTAMFFWPSFEDGETRAVEKGKQVKSNVDLANNTTHRMHFFVVYAAERQRSRIDYSRCVESEAFKSGLATECRLEIKSNGLVQYQPYNSDGVRMELSAEEDAILTEATESWRAEPGDWGPEWYVEPEEPEEPATGDDTGDGNESGGGGDNGGEDTGGDNDSGSTDDGNDNRGDTDTENGNDENNSGDTDDNNSVDDSSGSVTIHLGSILGNFGSEPISYAGSQTDGDANESKNNNANDNANNETPDNQENAEVTDNNVGVPVLDKEEESGPNWSAAAATLGVAAVGLAGWWFLFFGKYKFNKKKGEEKVED